MERSRLLKRFKAAVLRARVGQWRGSTFPRFLPHSERNPAELRAPEPSKHQVSELSTPRELWLWSRRSGVRVPSLTLRESLVVRDFQLVPSQNDVGYAIPDLPSVYQGAALTLAARRSAGRWSCPPDMPDTSGCPQRPRTRGHGDARTWASAVRSVRGDSECRAPMPASR
jgi:hypothetical protein